MVSIFASKLNGVSVIDNTAYIKGKITPAAHPISVKDFKLTYRIAKSLDNRFKLHASLDEIFNHNVKGVKGIITGPTTMVHSSVIDNFYNTKERAIYDMAKALSREAKELEKAGACALQIDEPFISTGAEKIEISKKAVEIISNSVEIPVILHVCGDLKDVLEDLLEFDVDILDFEFGGMAENIKTLEKYWYDECDKLIGIGCVDTKLEEIDDYESVKNKIESVLDTLHHDNIIIDPDCGMRMLDVDIADGKLNILKNIKNNGV